MERTTRVALTDSNRVYLHTASGEVAVATFDGAALNLIVSGQVLRLADEKAAEITAAMASARLARDEAFCQQCALPASPSVMIGPMDLML